MLAHPSTQQWTNWRSNARTFDNPILAVSPVEDTRYRHTPSGGPASVRKPIEGSCRLAAVSSQSHARTATNLPMPISAATSAIPEKAILALINRGWGIREHPDYPSRLWPATHLDRHFRRSIFSGLKTDGFEVIRKGNCPGRNHRGVVIRKPTGANVYQVFEGRTRKPTVCIGRIGVVSIIKQRIQEVLAKSPTSSKMEISDAELARFISRGHNGLVDSVAKLLKRLDEGCFVTEDEIAAHFDQLGVHFEELIFVHSAPYKTNDRRLRQARDTAYQRTAARHPRQIGADLWAGSEPRLYDLVRREKASCRVQSCDLGSVNALRTEEILSVLSEIKIALDACWTLPRDGAVTKLEKISRNLAESEFSAWFAHIPGSGDGDPEFAPRLIIVADKNGVSHDVIRMEGLFSILSSDDLEFLKLPSSIAE